MDRRCGSWLLAAKASVLTRAASALHELSRQPTEIRSRTIRETEHPAYAKTQLYRVLVWSYSTTSGPVHACTVSDTRTDACGKGYVLECRLLYVGHDASTSCGSSEHATVFGLGCVCMPAWPNKPLLVLLLICMLSAYACAYHQYFYIVLIIW